MNHVHTTSTAVEKLNRAARSLRTSTGCSLAAALDRTAQQAGYLSWKHVTECATRSGPGLAKLLPPDHRPGLMFVRTEAADRLLQPTSIAHLGELLGGMEPVILRQPCEHAPPGGSCLCQIDPFATAVRADVAMDVGDKYDIYNYLFDTSEPSQRYKLREVKMKLRIAHNEYYPNEQLVTTQNDDRSDSLNPNNPAHKASIDNRSMQLNPENARFGK